MKHLFISLIIASTIFVPLRSTQASNFTMVQEAKFFATAYYSPTPNQSKYHRGSYENDILLNGLGQVTASGNVIYKGAVAAPRDIPFGTVVEIDDEGFYVVEDRGSAIMEGNNSYRLDIWKGFGEDALNKAMSWGLRQRKGWIYPKALSKIEYHQFKADLNMGDTGNEVVFLQENLKAMGFFNHSVTGIFGQITADALYNYQLMKGIVPNREFEGAGRVGPNTRRKLNIMNELIAQLRRNKEEANKNGAASKIHQNIIKDFYSETLSEGDMNYNVYILQQKMSKLGYFNWPRYTYQYGEQTRNAVLSFQIRNGIVNSDNEVGAGVFGPTTRNKLKELLG